MKPDKITVYYDGACPRCLRELAIYRRFDRKHRVDWFDIVGNELLLKNQGIDPDYALKILHIRLPDGSVVRDIDAFIVLLRQIPIFRPLTTLFGIPAVKSLIERRYQRVTLKRLQRQGRLCDDQCTIKRE